ncbi:hypothetical protein GCM10010387_21670 [Streptomyces inusitatus]|uniref:Uncharacterized protein n=1 Tax=Streptomyces inusitatus TaxID=68221 RepID=A0A918PZ05_9ACTN|nr:hypothetical protein GCM10010387_21670 [Streptomyces inusitatus]
MTATFYERFHPDDMDGVVAYVAPNDVDNDEDSAYDRFFERVGTAEQRAGLRALEREGLIRREAMERRLAAEAAAEGLTFTTVGSLDKAYEAVVREVSWNYWAMPPEGGRPALPDPAALTDQRLYETLNGLVKLSTFADQNLTDFAYEYQAGTELGSPTRRTPAHLKGLTRYPYQPPRTFVPRGIPMTFKPKAMADIDRWVRDSARRMLFVNGEYDPWSAEPYRLGRGARDSAVLTAPGADHYAHIRDLSERDRASATAKLLRWAGVAPGAKRVAPGAPGPRQNLPR